MNRFLVCVSVVLVSCCAAAQNAMPGASTAAGATSVMTTASPELQQFQKIEDAWSMAVNKHDQFGLENVLSPLFLDVAANGDITTRNQQVVLVLNSDDKNLWLSQKVITVRMMGDIAVINGTYSLRHTVNGKPMDEKGVFTHVFERTHGGWLCTNSQRTVLRQDAPGGKAKRSSSSAEEPFHIPFFSKGDKNRDQ